MNNIELRRHLRDRKEHWQIQQAHWLDLLGLVVPLAAPLVPAYLTTTAIIEHYPDLLHIDWWWVAGIGVIAGAVIEVLGILSIETMFDMRTYNATAQEDEEKAPTEAAIIAVIFYLVLVIGLVLLLKIWSNLALWSLAPLTVLGFITSWVMVLRKQHAERVWKHEMSGTEQSEIEHLNAELERQSAVHLNAMNAELERHERQVAEQAERLNIERAERQAMSDELAALREQYTRLAERQSARREDAPQPKPKQATGKVDPARVHLYFVNNPHATTRQASDDLGYSIGSISKYKPVPVHLNGYHKEAAQ